MTTDRRKFLAALAGVAVVPEAEAWEPGPAEYGLGFLIPPGMTEDDFSINAAAERYARVTAVSADDFIAEYGIEENC